MYYNFVVRVYQHYFVALAPISNVHPFTLKKYKNRKPKPLILQTEVKTWEQFLQG